MPLGQLVGFDYGQTPGSQTREFRYKKQVQDYLNWLGKGGGFQNLRDLGSQMFGMRGKEAVAYAAGQGPKPQQPLFGWSRGDILGQALDFVNPMAKVGGLIGQTVYHGSPHRFDRFDISKIGSGEGAQMYGHGLYFAENPEVAGVYRAALGSGRAAQNLGQVGPGAVKLAQRIADEGLAVDDLLRMAQSGGLNAGQTRMVEALAQANELGGFVDEAAQMRGVLYKADIPDEWIPKMLDWDAPLGEQPKNVRDALQRIAEANPRVLEDPIGLKPQIKEFETPEQAKEFWDFARKEWQNTPNKKDRFKPKLRSNRKIEYYPPSTQAFGNATGGEIIDALRRTTGDDAFISAALRNAGVPGIKYLDQGSREIGEGTRNYVTFTDEGIKILERE